MTYSLARAADRDRDQIIRDRADKAGLHAALRLDEAFEHAFELIGGSVAYGVKKPAWTSDAYWFVLVDDLYWVIWYNDPHDRGHRVIARILHAKSEAYKHLDELL
jgi:plasmid stabilization system protein ParE